MTTKNKLPVYKEWLEHFTGTDVLVKELDEFTSLKFERVTKHFMTSTYITSCASHKLLTNEFGYNRHKMDDKDELFIMAVAAHEAGHFWDKEGMKNCLQKRFVLHKILVPATFLFLTLFVVTINFSFGIIGLVCHGLVNLLFQHNYNQDIIAEEIADKFVIDNLGLSSEFHVVVNLLSDIPFECEKYNEKTVKISHMTSSGYDVVKEYIEEIGIER